MRFLIIGSNSFSGSHFINKLLENNHKVLGISRSKQQKFFFLPYLNNKNISKFKFHKIDINKELLQFSKIVKKFRPNIVVNFAAQSMVSESWENPLHWYKTNIISSIKTIEFLKSIRSFKKFINFSTPEVYGHSDKWIEENFNFNPSTPYAISRSTFDQHLYALYKNKNFPVIFTRTANVYGSGQALYRIIPKLIMSIKNKTPFFLHGGGRSKRSFIHIKDVSEALYELVMKGKIGQTYHISTNKIISIKSLAQDICKQMNVNFSNIIKISEDRLGKDLAYKLSTAKIRKKIGWKPKINLIHGINEVINWIEGNYDKLKNIPLNYIHKK